MNEILNEFKLESKVLLQELLQLLEEIEGDFGQAQRLEDYGQKVDRIVGSAKTLALSFPKVKVLDQIGQYTLICKIVGYKASQIKDNSELFSVAVAFLLDTTEILQELVESVHAKSFSRSAVDETYKDRLIWIALQFDSNYRASVALESDDDSTKDQVLRLLKAME